MRTLVLAGSATVLIALLVTLPVSAHTDPGDYILVNAPGLLVVYYPDDRVATAYRSPAECYAGLGCTPTVWLSGVSEGTFHVGFYPEWAPVNNLGHWIDGGYRVIFRIDGWEVPASDPFTTNHECLGAAVMPVHWDLDRPSMSIQSYCEYE